jgi:hypothetical protein
MDRMKDGKRAARRGQTERMKARARRIMRLWAFGRQREFDARDVGRNASTHCRPCACWMCRYEGREVPPRRERAFADMELD